MNQNLALRCDRDKHKYISNLVRVLANPQASERLEPDLSELYVCRHHDLDRLIPAQISYYAKSAAQASYSRKDNS